MIKTLRITGVAAVAFAGVVLASVLGPPSWIRLGGQGDGRMDKILASAGAVDRFRELHAGDAQSNQDTTPPLVKQAEFFKDIIDPPVPTQVVARQASSTPARVAAPPRPAETSAKFTLLGTAYSPSDPNSSFAYVRALDNTCQWVQCGSELGHLTIKEVRESSIVCWDGNGESVLTMEETPDRASLLEADAEPVVSAADATPQPVEVRAVVPPSNRSRSRNRLIPPAAQTPPSLSPDEQRSLGDLADKLRRLHGGPGGDPVADANRAEALDKLISEFKSSRVGPEETKNLESLGGEPNIEKERAREQQKREFIRRLNTSRPSRD